MYHQFPNWEGCQLLLVRWGSYRWTYNDLAMNYEVTRLPERTILRAVS